MNENVGYEAAFEWKGTTMKDRMGLVENLRTNKNKSREIWVLLELYQKSKQ